MRFLVPFFALISLVSAAEKPNILFIFADDMIYEAIGSLGFTEVETPSLDKLILYPGGSIARFYNLKEDPFEKNDLLEKGEGKKIAQKLFEVLKSEAKIHGDELVYGEYPMMR